MPTFIIVVRLTPKFEEKSSLIGSFKHDVIDRLVVAYFFGPPYIRRRACGAVNVWSGNWVCMAGAPAIDGGLVSVCRMTEISQTVRQSRCRRKRVCGSQTCERVRQTGL